MNVFLWRDGIPVYVYRNLLLLYRFSKSSLRVIDVITVKILFMLQNTLEAESLYKFLIRKKNL